jgi:hypothetical protein
VTQSANPVLNAAMGRVHQRISSARGLMSERKSFVFSTEASQRLERMRAACRMETSASVIRLACLVLEDLVTAVQSGGTISITYGDGTTRSYHPLLESEPRAADGSRIPPVGDTAPRREA